MRINRYLSLAKGLSRRKADDYIKSQRVQVDNKPAKLGQEINANQAVSIDGQSLSLPKNYVTIMLNKPIGYVVSRNGQGSKTIYELLPALYRNLKPVGRLDKNSSGLLLLTNNGQLAASLTHPRFEKMKNYKVSLDKALTTKHQNTITGKGINLDDGYSSFSVKKLAKPKNTYLISMSEGRNRQIRRTFETLGYTVISLHRISFGEYKLNNLTIGKYSVI